MTGSPTPAERAALRVAEAALESRDTAYGIASTIVFALGAAQLLQSPEAAAELDKTMEDLTGARLSLWEEEQENARLFLAWGSARMRARRKNEALKKLRARVDEVERKYIFDTAELKQKVAELEAAAPAELTVYRASHDSITFGLYTTVEAAWTHCKTYAEREFPAPFAAYWTEYDDGVTELMVSVHGSADIATGYMVTPLVRRDLPLTVASAYDPDGDE